MIIKSLEIYGYGQFVQRKIEFNKNFTEIFGENEKEHYSDFDLADFCRGGDLTED